MNKNEKDKIKVILSQWGSDSGIIDYEKEEIERIKEIIDGMTNVRAVVYSHVPKSKNIGSPVENSIINSIEICEKRLKKITERIDKYNRDKDIIDNIISDMTFDMQFIIKAKYADNKSWDQIASSYPYSMSIRNFYRIHNEALEFVNERLKNAA